MRSVSAPTATPPPESPCSFLISARSRRSRTINLPLSTRRAANMSPAWSAKGSFSPGNKRARPYCVAFEKRPIAMRRLSIKPVAGASVGADAELWAMAPSAWIPSRAKPSVTASTKVRNRRPGPINLATTPRMSNEWASKVAQRDCLQLRLNCRRRQPKRGDGDARWGSGVADRAAACRA